MGEGDRERRSDDPFEDLDSFFAPIEGVQWPEDEHPSQVPTAHQDDARTVQSRVNPHEQEPEDRTVVVPEAGPPAAGAEAGDLLATREMSGEEWRRLRDVLGDDEADHPAPPFGDPLIVLDDQAEVWPERDMATVPDERGRSIASGMAAGAAYGSEAPGFGIGSGTGSGSGPGRTAPVPMASGERDGTAGEQGSGSPVPPAQPVGSSGPTDPPLDDDLSAAWPDQEYDDEPGSLTLDDLKKAPPEYVGLPGPRDPATIGPRARPESPPPGASTTPPGGAHVQVVGGAAAAAADPPPSLSEVEAMADNLAREFRSSPTEDVVAEPPDLPDDLVHWDADQGPGEPRQRSAESPPFDDDLVGEFEAPEPPEPAAPKRGPRTVKVGAPEDLSGPSWEDPTARTVTREKASAPSRGDRDLPMAVITGAALVALALLALAFKPFAFAVVAGLVIVIAQAEFYAATQRQGYHPATLLGLVAGAMIVAGAYYRGEAGILAMIILALVATFLWFMATPARSRTDVIANAGVTMFGLLYVPVLGSFYVLLLAFPPTSRGLVLAVLGLTFLYDVAAFFIGRYWGRRPLAPTISPKKSWEGLGGATVVTVLVASVLPRSFGPLTSEWRLVELGLVIVLFAPIGDLVESMLKRDLGIKDMGSILPGHGGMLDRVDSALLVGPAVYYLLRLIS